MAAPRREISPAVAGVIVAVVLVLIVILGVTYINRPKADTIAQQVYAARKQNGQPVNGPAPLGGQPPHAGAADYAPSSARPPTQGR